VYLESFNTFPQRSQYENSTFSEAEASHAGIGKDLFAFEVGNEFDGKSPP
jgi:hypothetical protein